MGDDELDAVEHMRLSHYLSTYCFHEDHGNCRLTCKVCEAPCRCGCHTPSDVAEPALGSERAPCVCGHDYDDHTSGVAVGRDVMDEGDDKVCSCTTYRPESKVFRCDHGRMGNEACPMCDAGIEATGAKCTTGDHLDEPAAGDAWGGDEDRPDQRVPFCAECLTRLGDDYDACWWQHNPTVPERQTCGGSGLPVDGPPGNLAGPCQICGRLVTVADDDGKAMDHPAHKPTCPACFGRGYIDIPCKLCAGSGSYDLTPLFERHVTTTSKELDALADEAEQGYVVAPSDEETTS